MVICFNCGRDFDGKGICDDCKAKINVRMKNEGKMLTRKKTSGISELFSVIMNFFAIIFGIILM